MSVISRDRSQYRAKHQNSGAGRSSWVRRTATLSLQHAASGFWHLHTATESSGQRARRRKGENFENELPAQTRVIQRPMVTNGVGISFHIGTKLEENIE